MPEIKWFTNYEYVEPQSAIEKIVCEVFGRVLEIERFGANLKVHDTCYTVDIIVKKETVKYEIMECDCGGVQEVANRPSGISGTVHT